MTSVSATELLGDPAAFFATQRHRLSDLGIDIDGYPLSHLAFRTSTVDEYLDMRDQLERHSTANVENVWNGRRISKLLLRRPLPVAPGVVAPLIELIPPPHQAVYQMGLEHVGVVLGEHLDEFADQHQATLTGRQDQGRYCMPFFITFPDHTNVKFYAHSLHDVCVFEGRRFDGFRHAEA